MTAEWAPNCHYNIVHVLSSPQTITTGVGVAKCWADLEILPQYLRQRCRPTHGCKSVTTSSTMVIQVFINLLDTIYNANPSIYLPAYISKGSLDGQTLPRCWSGFEVSHRKSANKWL